MSILAALLIALLVLTLVEVWYYCWLLIIALAQGSDAPWLDAWDAWSDMPTPWRYWWSA
jgi:hypothetical protein